MNEDYFSNDEYWKKHIHEELEIDMWIDEYNEYLKNNGKCLELGCGIGQYSKRLMEYGYEVISTDISEIALNEVEKFNKNILKVDMSKPLPFKDNEFDLVFSNLSIHYFSEKLTDQLINEIFRVIKKDGLFIGSVNGTEGYNYIKDTAVKIENHFYFNKNKYIHLFDEEELTKYFSKFEIRKIEKRGVKRFGHNKNYWIFIVKK